MRNTVEYSLDGSGPFELDVEETLIAGGDPTIAGGDVRFKLVTKLGLETWNGEVRTANLTKVVMTVCPPWTQTAGPDIDL